MSNLLGSEMSWVPPFISSILSILSAIVALLVITPYLLNRFCYKPNLYIYVHGEYDNKPVIPRNGGNVNVAIHARNKQRIIVDSVWLSFPGGQKATRIEFTGLPALLSGDTIPPRTTSHPPILIQRQMVIGSSDKHVGLARFFCRVDEDVSELVVEIAILAHIHQGDLPIFINMYPPPLTEHLFTETIRIRS